MLRTNFWTLISLIGFVTSSLRFIVMVCELGWFDEGRAKIEAAEKERLWNLFLDI
jgi:hypothetical protein